MNPISGPTAKIDLHLVAYQTGWNWKTYQTSSCFGLFCGMTAGRLHRMSWCHDQSRHPSGSPLADFFPSSLPLREFYRTCFFCLQLCHVMSLVPPLSRWLRCRVPWCICLPMWFTSTSRTFFLTKMACQRNFWSSGFFVWHGWFFFGDQKTIQPNKQKKSEHQNFEITCIRCCMDMWYQMWLIVVVYSPKKELGIEKKWCFNCCWQAPWHDSCPALIFAGKKTWTIWMIRILVYIICDYTQETSWVPEQNVCTLLKNRFLLELSSDSTSNRTMESMHAWHFVEDQKAHFDGTLSTPLSITVGVSWR